MIAPVLDRGPNEPTSLYRERPDFSIAPVRPFAIPAGAPQDEVVKGE
jgi:hypothetical protein